VNVGEIFSSLGALTKFGSAGVVIVMFGYLLIHLIGILPNLKKFKADADGASQDRFMKRIEGLEDDNAKIREDFNTRIDAERNKHEVEAKSMRVQYEADLRLMRHEIRNLREMLDMLMFIAEEGPDKLGDFVKRFRLRIDTMDANVATEKGAVISAKINAAKDC
jgi:hypothetical protein